MKKLLLSSFVMAAISGSVISQSIIDKENFPNYVGIEKHQGEVSFKRNNTSAHKTSAVEHYDYDFTSAVVGAYGQNNFTLFVQTVFQDSVVKESSSNGNDNVFVHKVGAVLDPTSDFFQSQALTQWTPYTIDTIFIGGYYSIPTAVSSPTSDTLQIEIVWDDLTGTSVFSYLSYNTEPNKAYPAIKNTASLEHGNKSFVTAPGTKKLVIKKVLTAQDTGTNNPFSPFIAIPLNPELSIPAGNIVGVAATFIPGYSYTANDVLFQYTNGTLSATISSFRALMYQENQTGANNFYDGGLTANVHYSSSAQLLQSVGRYGIAPAASDLVNKNMLPYPNLGFVFNFGVNADITGIEKFADNGVKLGQNMPNPFNHNTIIKYQIEENASIELEVYDITGKVIYTIQEGKKSAGVHSVSLDASKFKSGFYFYSLKKDGYNVATRKMQVVN